MCFFFSIPALENPSQQTLKPNWWLQRSSGAAFGLVSWPKCCFLAMCSLPNPSNSAQCSWRSLFSCSALMFADNHLTVLLSAPLSVSRLQYHTKKKTNALKNIKLLHRRRQFSLSRHGNPQGTAHTRPWEAPGGAALNPHHDGKEKSSAFVQELGRNPPGEPKAVEKLTPGAKHHLGTHCSLRHLLREILVKWKSTDRILNNP